MAYTYHDLKQKTVQELRDIAKDVQHDAVQGYSQMNKDHLLPALGKHDGLTDSIVHQHAVRQAGEGVMRCQVPQLLVGGLEVLGADDHRLLQV